MTRQFELENYYSLLQAFDQLGKHLYSDVWSGLEAFSKPVASPVGLAGRRAELDDQIEELEVQLISLRKKFQRLMPGPERQQADQQIGNLHEEKTALELKKGKLPDYRDSHVVEFETYARREKSEALLLDGLIRGEVEALYGTQFIIDWKEWCQETGFTCFLPLSIMTVPPKISSLRRAPVFVSKDPFNKWWNALSPIVEKTVLLSLEQQAEIALKGLVAAGKMKHKQACFELVKETVPELSP